MKTAACLIVKNEEADVAEWMAFHLAAGFDALLVYDHGSTDRTAAVVRAAARVCDARLTDWRHDLARAQEAAYADACRRHAAEFDWIAFVDADEFVLPSREGGVGAFLAGFGEDVGAVALNWAMFGSSGHDREPRGFVSANFLNRAPDAFGPNRHVKSLVRPARVSGFVNPHFAALDSGRYADALGGPVAWQTEGLVSTPPLLGPCRVNHYFTRSRAHWERRLARGQRTRRTWKDFEAYDRNEVQDKSALRFLPAVAVQTAAIQQALREDAARAA